MFERSQYMAGYYPQQAFDGKDVLTIVVKRTYAMNLVEATCEVADEQSEINLGDVYTGDEDPFKSSIKYESDIAPWKAKKDVVFVGKAYAPKGKPVPSWEVTLQVGPHKRSLLVYGPRKATYVPPPERKKGPPEPQPPIFSDPEPVDMVELTYENAYGGFGTYYPEDPDIYRKAIRKEKKKQKKKEEKKKEDEQKKLDELEGEEKKKAEKAKAKEEAAQKRSYFYHGVKSLKDAPDMELEVEIGSAHKKSADGALVLDMAELAEVEAREAAEEAKRLAEEVADAADDSPKIAEDGAMLADADMLAEQARDLSEEAEAERLAFEEERRLDSDTVDESARFIDAADRGDEVTADDSWLMDQKRRREEFYEGLGQDPDTEIQWEDGEFPRLPCPTNFVGKGFAMRNCVQSLDELDLPQIEDPKNPLKPEDVPIDPATLHLPTLPKPAGWGFISKGWVPRSYQAGILPHEIEEIQHKLDKEVVEELNVEDEEDQSAIDVLLNREAQVMDRGFYNGANPVWQIEHLDGDEDVFLTNLDANGSSFFKLPSARPYVRFDRGEGWEQVEVDLDTLIIDREDEKVFMVWRGEVQYGGPDDIGEWPRTDIDVQDLSMLEWRDRKHDEEIAKALEAKDGLKLGEDEISDEEAAEFDKHIVRAGVGLGGVKEEVSAHLKEVRAKDGALVDLQDREDVILADDGWVADTRDAQLTEEERKQLELERDERKAVQAKKDEMKKRREEQIQKKKEEEEAAAEAEKKKKKKKKEDEPSPDDDEDTDDDPPPEPEPPAATEAEAVARAPKSAKTSEVAKKRASKKHLKSKPKTKKK